MEFEIKHGVRTFLRHDEMSPLERAIQNYEKKAAEYFRGLNANENALPDIREKRKRELDKIKRHLENERRLINVLADLQADLDAYREYGRGAVDKNGVSRSEALTRRGELLLEEHHPTETLEKYMRAVPDPKPSAQHTAHHIVPGKGKTRFAYRARVKLHTSGIRINDPDNGVWLPTKARHTPHWSMPQAKGHLQYHTLGYEQWIAARLETKFGELFIRQELRILARFLQENKLPPEARKK